MCYDNKELTEKEKEFEYELQAAAAGYPGAKPDSQIYNEIDEYYRPRSIYDDVYVVDFS